MSATKFKVGDLVRIIDNVYGHGLKIGSVHPILKQTNYDYYITTDNWAIEDDEIELVVNEAKCSCCEKCGNFTPFDEPKVDEEPKYKAGDVWKHRFWGIEFLYKENNKIYAIRPEGNKAMLAKVYPNEPWLYEPGIGVDPDWKLLFRDGKAVG